MAGRFQLRRGNTAQNDAFIGAEGEVTYDTQAKGIRVHDGVTPGGNALFGVVEFQHPTAANNYTWYRKYSDGWVEQGGKTSTVQAGTGIGINLPVTMADTNYSVYTQPVRVNTDDYWYESLITSITTASLTITPVRNGSGTDTAYVFWKVCGMAA